MSNNIFAKLQSERSLPDGEHVQVYEVGRYLVIIRGQRQSTGSHLWVEVRFNEELTNSRSYLPGLSVCCFDDDGIPVSQDIRVHTVSYGALPSSEIIRFMDEMQEGVDTAKYIGEKIIQPMVDGKWDWEVLS